MSDTVLMKRLKRLGRRFLVMGTVIYVAFCTLLYLCQGWVAFPGASEQGTIETNIHYGSETQMLHLTTRNGIPLAAVFGSADQPDRPTILYFYGNAGSVAWSQNEFDHFRSLNCNVLIPDLPGYGASGGKASEANFYAAADASWDYLQVRRGIDPKKIIVVGWSMGSAVAIDLASRKPVWGLATFNAFTTLPAMARKFFPWAPMSLLLKYKFDNQTKIPAVHCPILICNGKLDSLVSPEMSDQLAAVAGGTVTRVVIATADHNSIFMAEPDRVWGAMRNWIAGIK